MIIKQRKIDECTPILCDKAFIPATSSSTILPLTCDTTKLPEPCTITLLLSTFIPSLGGLLYGYDQTVMESLLALPNFQHHYFYGNLLIGGFNPFDYLTFGYCIMAISGSLYTGYICDQAGRKRSLMGAFLLFALGTFLEIACSHSLAFLTGRLIVGIGSGIFLVAATCMISELAPANLRGCLVGFFGLFAMAGQLSGYYVMNTMGPRISASMSSSFFPLILQHSSWSFGWRTPIALEICICLLAILAQSHLPDSPRWLIWTFQHCQDKNTDAVDEGLLAIARLQERPLNDPMVQQLWKRIFDDYGNMATYDYGIQQEYMDCLSTLLSSLVGTTRRQHYSSQMHRSELLYYQQQQRKRRLLLACGLILANTMTGYDVLMKNYASAIFYASDLHETTNLFAANGCIFSMTLVVMAVSLGWCVDYFNRKNFLFTGALVMALCHLGLGGVFQWFIVVDWQTGSVLLVDPHARMVAITCVYLFLVIYSFIWGPLVLTTICEWFSVGDRARGMALVACVAWSSQWCLTVFSRYLFMSPFIYYIYGAAMLVSCSFIYRWVPNTTAKSLEEIAGMVF